MGGLTVISLEKKQSVTVVTSSAGYLIFLLKKKKQEGVGVVVPCAGYLISLLKKK